MITSFIIHHLSWQARECNVWTIATNPLSLSTVFEVVIDAKVHRVEWKALQRWILKERQERNGSAGFLFSQRPTLE